MNILMVASENDALPQCKVGGIADVMRDLPAALIQKGCAAGVAVPSHGFLCEQICDLTPVQKIPFLFADTTFTAVYYQCRDAAGVVNTIVDAPEFYHRYAAGEPARIYCDDVSDAPFATDAVKFAFFSRAVAEGIKHHVFGPVTTVHLHDWHTAFFLILRRYHQDYKILKKLWTVFTVHNLGIQGIRPFQGHYSSLKSWYPDLFTFEKNQLADRRWPDCINPMAAGIRLADAVNTVSPTYAREILKPSDPPVYYGGDGLETDLNLAQKNGRLFGILNGCDYRPAAPVPVYCFPLLIEYFKKTVRQEMAREESLRSSLFLTLEKLSAFPVEKYAQPVVLTSIGRMVEQKFFLLRAAGDENFSALKGILQGLKNRGIYVLLGTGNRDYASFLTEMSLEYENLIFLNLYSNACAEMLYANGDLFLMPSSYEPCGISQMIAMREGQPCVVHGVGGLNDTVEDRKNGFVFHGDTVAEKADRFVEKCLEAVEMRENHGSAWNAVCTAAKKTRFTWDKSAERYIHELYR